MPKKLLTVREVSQILNISEKRVLELVEEGKIPAYRVNKEFLRFDPEKIYPLLKDLKSELEPKTEKISFKEKVLDFFYFYDFYIISFLLFLILIYFIIKAL